MSNKIVYNNLKHGSGIVTKLLKQLNTDVQVLSGGYADTMDLIDLDVEKPIIFDEYNRSSDEFKNIFNKWYENNKEMLNNVYILNYED